MFPVDSKENDVRKLGIGIVALTLAGVPLVASASTHSGNITCGAGGATVAVRGEMQRLQGNLVLKVNGSVRYDKGNAYVGYGYSSHKSGSWSGSAETLLFSGTYGYCNAAGV